MWDVSRPLIISLRILIIFESTRVVVTCDHKWFYSFISGIYVLLLCTHTDTLTHTHTHTHTQTHSHTHTHTDTLTHTHTHTHIHTHTHTHTHTVQRLAIIMYSARKYLVVVLFYDC